MLHNTNDKICLLTKLCKKYLKKFKQITILLTKVNQNKNDNKELLDELNDTIEKFWSTLHNPTIIKPLLDINQSIDYKAKELFEDEIENKKLIKFNPGFSFL